MAPLWTYFIKPLPPGWNFINYFAKIWQKANYHLICIYYKIINLEMMHKLLHQNFAEKNLPSNLLSLFIKGSVYKSCIISIRSVTLFPKTIYIEVSNQIGFQSILKSKFEEYEMFSKKNQRGGDGYSGPNSIWQIV